MNNIAFLIGCEEYEQEDILNLVGVNSDVDSMSLALVRNCNCSPERMFVITNQQSGACELKGASILKFLIKKANEFKNELFDDLFFYFSGHGYLSQDNNVCLMPSDSFVHPFQYGAITIETIIRALKQFNHVKHIILFLDICQDELISKGPITEKLVDPSYFPKGTIVFFSCLPQKSSYMIPDTGIEKYGSGSVFTKCLVEALSAQSGCRTVNEISEYLKKVVPALSSELGLEQKPFTQLQDTSLGEVLIVNQFNSASIELNEAELKALEEFALKIDVNESELCIQLGTQAEKQLSELCSSIVNFITSNKGTGSLTKSECRKTDFYMLVRDFELFNTALLACKQKKNKMRLSWLRREQKEPLLDINILESEKGKFIERLEYHRGMIMMDIALLDNYKNLFFKYTREIQMYIYAAERAIEINADKNSDILLMRTSYLRDAIQNCRGFVPDVDKQKEFLANLVMRL